MKIRKFSTAAGLLTAVAAVVLAGCSTVRTDSTAVQQGSQVSESTQRVQPTSRSVAVSQSDQIAPTPIADSTPSQSSASVPNTASDSPPPATGQVWGPPDAPTPIVLDKPADGAVVELQLGDRLVIPSWGSLGRTELTSLDGVLVPYGAPGVFLAASAGTVPGQVTEYDPSHSCIPPQPVSRFQVTVTARGTDPKIPAAAEVTPEDGGTTVHLVPGQAIELADSVGKYPQTRLDLRVGDDTSTIYSVVDRLYALHPGTSSLTITGVQNDKQVDVTLTLVVDDPFPRGLRAPGEFGTIVDLGGRSINLPTAAPMVATQAPCGGGG